MDYTPVKRTVGPYKVCYALTPDGHCLGWTEDHRGYVVGKVTRLDTLALAQAWADNLVAHATRRID